MGFRDLTRSLLQVADGLTGGTSGFQDTVHLYYWTGIGDFGEPTYQATAIGINAIVIEKQFKRRLSNGEDVIQKAEITIPRPLAAQGAANRREPIDPRDKLVLPNGYTGPILSVDGPVDPATHLPFMMTVILG